MYDNYIDEIMNSKFSWKKLAKYLRKALEYTGIKKDAKLKSSLCALFVLNIFVPILFPILSRELTNASVQITNTTGAFWTLLCMIVFYAAAKILYEITNGILYFILNKIMVMSSINIREEILNTNLQMPLKYFNSDKINNKLQFINSTIPMNMEKFINNCYMGLVKLISVLSIYALLWGLDFKIAIIMVIGTIPQVVWITKGNNLIFENTFRQAKLFIERDKVLSIAMDKNPEKIVYDLYKILEERFDSANKKIAENRKTMNLRLSTYRLFAGIVIAGCYLFAIGLTITEIIENNKSIGELSLLISLLPVYGSDIAALLNKCSWIVYSMKYFDNYSYYLTLAEEGRTKRKNGSIEDKPIEIEFRDVTFTYPGSETAAIKHLNLKIVQGEKIAIVGQNGSGKSTFTYLLTGLYKASHGEILINGMNINENPEMCRRLMSIIFQDSSQYSMSIWDNIRIGDISRKLGREEVIRICKKTGVDKIAEGLEEGLNALVGELSEEGVNLSSGQWQRIMLARALIRENAKIVILDEPTAALDPKAEAQLYTEFSSMTGDKAAVVISHRLGITKVVDRILVFKDGTIIEEGDHLQLMRKKGIYYRMYTSQAEWYL